MLRRNSIINRYLLTFLLILVLPIFAAAIITYSYVNNQLSSIFERNSEEQFNAFANSIEYQLSRLTISMATVAEYDSGKIVDLVSQWSHTNELEKKLEISDQIDSSLSLLFNFSGEIDSVVFFLKDGASYSYKNQLKKPEDEVREQEWYKETLKRPGKTQVLGNFNSITSSTNRYVLSIAVCPKISKYRGNVELVYVEMKTDLIEGINDKYSFMHDNGDVFIVDESYKIILSNRENNIGHSIEEYTSLLSTNKNIYETSIKNINGEKKMVGTYRIGNIGWTIVSMNDYSIILNKTYNILKPLVIVLLITIISFMIYSIIFFRGIIGPINKLIKNINIVKAGNFTTELKPLKGSSEISELSNSYIDMINRVNALIVERDLKEKQRSETEIKALQAQINPHFLFNTLNSIKLMALLVCADNIKTTTEALMNILSETFRDINSLITISTEINVLNNYIYIMKVRYGDKFDFICNIDDDILEKYILKMLLQPIVENAILHGIISNDKRGIIEVKGYKSNEEIVFEITDNGCGMTEDMALGLLNPSSPKTSGLTGIGLNNVNQRLKLNYGEQYGVKISSVEGQFTKIVLNFPTINESSGAV